MNEITIVGDDGHELVEWEVRAVLRDVIERWQARTVAEFELLARRQITQTLNRLRGRAD